MRIHLTGIGGVGMAGLAFLLKRRGHVVDGCDLKPTPRTQWLEASGIPVAIGHDARHVEGKDLVIVTPAVAKDNPEYLAAARTPQPQLSADGQLGMRPPGRSVMSRGEVLAELVSSAPDSIAVCGSHGKTTTATFIAKLLIELGESVEWAIGGETGEFPVAGIQVGSKNDELGMAGDKSVLVVEADESDGTLALYHAKTLVVTNCEYDHPDHFKTKAEYFACYDQARKNAAQVIEGAERDGSSRSDSAPCGSQGASDSVRELVRPCDSQGASDSVRELARGDPNAELAVRVALSRGHSPEAIAAVLPRVTAELPDRRFQRIFPSVVQPSTSNLQPLVFTDYGHHPTEIRYAITRARNLLAIAREGASSTVRVLFQPHRYSRTAAFKREFAEALMLADEVVICPIYAAFEKPIEGGDSCDLYAALREETGKFHSQPSTSTSNLGVRRRVKIFLAKSCEDAWEHARNSMQPGDITLIQGAGDLLEKVRNYELGIKNGGVEIRKIWEGAGTNTVKSDLNLSVEYVKSDSPAGRIGMELLSPHSSFYILHSTLFPWMAGIPGTLGGWVKMNAGAHGHSIGEVIESVKVDGTWIPASECGFGYRTSKITGEIQDVRFRADGGTGASHLPSTGSGGALAPTESPEYYLSLRRKFPPHTKGSVFKNPPGDFAGRLLEECGCKGLCVGGAHVWDAHANVIVNEGTASDFLALLQIMQNRVFLRKNIKLDPEVRI